MSRTLFAMIVALLLATFAAAQDAWQIDPAHSSAQFAVRHLGISTVRGAFTKVSGGAQFDPADPSKSSIQADIDAASVDTRVDARDNDLRSPKFFDVQKFPTITFKSTKVESAGEGKLRVTGGLTIHGVTKEVVLDVDGPSAPMKDPRGNLRIGASATTTINRQDFGVGGASGMVGDQVTITLDVEMSKTAGK
jgi:polyisoprenoid-binding protein YceI